MQPRLEAQPRLIQPIKRLVAIVTRRGNQESPLTGTTRQNSLDREVEQLRQNVERGIFLEHESYKKFLAQSGRSIPDMSGFSSKDFTLTPGNSTGKWVVTSPDREYVNQTYKEYLVEKYTKEYKKRGKHSDPQAYVSYDEYLIRSGRKYIPIYHGEALSDSDREYVTQTYREYLAWHDEKNEYRKKLISRLDSDPLLSKEGRERILEEDERSTRNWHQHRLEQYLRYGDTLPPIIEDGKIMSPSESFMLYDLQQERLEREALARGEEYKRPPLPLRPIDLQPLTPERRLQRDLQIVRDADYQLSKEANDAQYDKIAEVIQTKVWRDSMSGRGSVTIKPYHQIDMSINADGSSIINRSRSGTTIGNAHDALTFGIGYFTDRAAIIDEAQGLLSDDELQTGVKANFIQHTYTVEEEGKKVEKTEMIVIPHAYAEHVQLFCAFLHNAAKIISPDEYITKIRRSLQLETRKAPILRRAAAA